MFKKLFGGGWKVISGALLHFVVPIVLTNMPPQVTALTKAVGDVLMVVGAGHKLEKVGKTISDASNGGVK